MKTLVPHINVTQLLTLLCCFFISFTTVSFAENPSKDSKPSLVAEFEGQKIMREELVSFIKTYLPEQGISLKDTDMREIEKQMLQNLINRKLLLALAREKHLTPSEDIIREQIEKTKAAAGSEEVFLQELQKRRLTEKSLRDGLIEDLSIVQYLNQFVFNSINISETDVKAAYTNNAEQFRTPRERRVKQIMFKLGSNPSNEDLTKTKQRAEQVYKELTDNPENFDELAKKYSDGPTRTKGGDLGFITYNQLDPEFSDPVFRSPLGEISPIIQTKYGFHIVKVTEERGGEIAIYNQVKDAIEKTLKEQASNKVLTDYLKQLREEKKVVIYMQ